MAFRGLQTPSRRHITPTAYVTAVITLNVTLRIFGLITITLRIFGLITITLRIFRPITLTLRPLPYPLSSTIRFEAGVHVAM